MEQPRRFVAQGESKKVCMVLNNLQEIDLVNSMKRC